MYLYVMVTAADIESGWASARSGKMLAETCPLSLAIRRATGDGRAIIGKTKQHVAHFWGAFHDLPARAVKFAVDFDNGVAVHPFQFPIRLKRAVWTKWRTSAASTR